MSDELLVKEVVALADMVCDRVELQDRVALPEGVGESDIVSVDVALPVIQQGTEIY